MPGDLTRRGAEIDAVEYFGQGYPKGGLATFLYYKNAACDYTFHVDGRVLFTTNKGVSQAPEYLILSLLTSDWGLPNLDLRAAPQQMNVDWVRVWK